MIASFLQRHDIRFAAAKIKKHSYNKKVAGALYVLDSTGGYREVSVAMAQQIIFVGLALPGAHLKVRKAENFSCQHISSSGELLWAF
ncbi:hypothetical protein PC116_g13441 [Phytophthora cactorum]|uniref:Uncharacterized protein n=1 Tax=Phytophthora cactorum TaxID=29920 RepID=A0A8T1DL83_9STRA|nr:hypothetical protein PC112_g9859 [Phytophthora cactorum]KAG2826938.1 hypothetical protein PC111_g8772 [Phytophthora cactorum]KAG2858050.1 hypothetical protein PC113_g10144 [Phytophthora cactorum]KAG2899584.1 hypothetical protein PC115_g16484 [Phytophthora cactorum]KAG2907883.1 hypothetical protein PC114_g10689 [Phytophthora cactorum]